ncbi:hypothetical protein [Cryobacterium sp. TMT4-10]|uniref:hypothetical protein n=1 Tax=Cryobacterium sp. TMT4-10 TaxID=1259256 RepID=UPI00106B5E0C|nr:hypothetical protein [Cryobacterium sp. TMT4-10]TFD16309.1 hypothetical protein E3T42_09490 [Cryobacterium sp. TMT4-10]
MAEMKSSSDPHLSAVLEDKPRVHRRRWFRWVVVSIGVSLVIVSRVGVRLLAVKAELQAAIPLASTIKAQLLSGDSAGSISSVDDLAKHTESARSLTSHPVWRRVELIPFLGANLSAVREVAAVSNDVVIRAVKPLVASTAILSSRPVLKNSAGRLCRLPEGG